MKKFVEILEEVKNTTKAIEKAEQNEKALVDKYLAESDLKSRVAKKKSLEGEMVENAERILELKLTRRILKSNARVALFLDAVPTALEVLNKYAGKPYGEKTRQKISDEVAEKTGCAFYIGCRYSAHGFTLYPRQDVGNDYNLSCGLKNGAEQQKILIDNKIQKVDAENVALWYVSSEYVEDIPGRIAELKALHKKALELQKQLDAICGQYNDLAVSEIPHIYADKRISARMEV